MTVSVSKVTRLGGKGMASEKKKGQVDEFGWMENLLKNREGGGGGTK